jgi:hypothetical protein
MEVVGLDMELLRRKALLRNAPVVTRGETLQHQVMVKIAIKQQANPRHTISLLLPADRNTVKASARPARIPLLPLQVATNTTREVLQLVKIRQILRAVGIVQRQRPSISTTKEAIQLKKTLLLLMEIMMLLRQPVGKATVAVLRQRKAPLLPIATVAY